MFCLECGTEASWKITSLGSFVFYQWFQTPPKINISIECDGAKFSSFQLPVNVDWPLAHLGVLPSITGAYDKAKLVPV